MEGLLSACYHLCPTRSNLQLDVVFIYGLQAAIVLKNHLASKQESLTEFQVTTITKRMRMSFATCISARF